MDEVARLSNSDRADVFRGAADKLHERLAVSALILEKDFWVCWALEKVFGLPVVKGLLFKGGTSLSKGYSLIQRFSEDIDLVLDRGSFNSPDPMENGISGKERQRRCEALTHACHEFISGAVVPALKADFESVLGPDGWALSIDEADRDCVVFSYPPSLEEDYGSAAYISPAVRLELGVRGEHTPSETREITPYIAEAGFDRIKIGTASVRVLHPRRTFWEKVLIHHRSCHKPPDDSHRHSRHSYDLATMSNTWVGKAALDDLPLLADVVSHERIMFRRAPAAVYDDAKPGSIRLVPDGKALEALRLDFKNMEQMFFGKAPDFDGVIARLRELEREVNGAK